MLDVRDNRLFVDNVLVGDENYIMSILQKAMKYDQLETVFVQNEIQSDELTSDEIVRGTPLNVVLGGK